MKIELLRISSDQDSTLGRMAINGVAECVTVEDQRQDGPKVRGETRIPAGTYAIKLKDQSRFDAAMVRRR